MYGEEDRDTKLRRATSNKCALTLPPKFITGRLRAGSVTLEKRRRPDERTPAVSPRMVDSAFDFTVPCPPGRIEGKASGAYTLVINQLRDRSGA